MPTALPVPTKNPGDILTSTLWNSYVRDNVNKLLNLSHRVLTVAQFAAITTPEGTKGAVAPDEVYVEVDSTNGVQWHVAYESGEITNKWRFIGGPPLVAEVTTDESTASTTYAALATAGPSVSLPRGGDYDVEVESVAYASSAAQVSMSYDIGGTGAVDADRAYHSASPVTSEKYHRRKRRKTVTAASTLTAKYKTGAGTGNFVNRVMWVTPVRIRHDA